VSSETELALKTQTDLSAVSNGAAFSLFVCATQLDKGMEATNRSKFLFLIHVQMVEFQMVSALLATRATEGARGFRRGKLFGA